mmetsp:Transcript_31357/g.74524  ORF Transcript_31357/g.74524 Transcript_31357/m.74524 type:complete len:187 (+) Transcript_31357:142-702(+)|eukprot:CAMPEP_0180178076 /NCGR_PEP_ID=MMETSP0986-20121125/38203_1 /TAXON_ID=697907 /ORGANISM="non described non described, Strain CCMP2293" /LENGTH=186 /DNA_ID=CAMNT_0022130881 /DNA_START=83 /DNA_END=643 /DNA_ORIENTATION=+
MSKGGLPDFDCCGGCRGKPSTLRSRAAEGPVTQAGQDGSQCGIGVVFRMDTHGALVVDSLVTGGPAWESSTNGGLQVSDVLQTVDGKNVYRWPVAQLAPLLLGPEGTTVRLGVQRSSKLGESAEKREEVLRSLIIDVQRKRFSPPPEPFSNSRPPIVDARRGLGGKETVRTGNPATGMSEGQFTAA